MILDDRARFASALQRLGRLERLPLDDHAMRDWWAQLVRYPIDAVVWALEEAPGERERRGERLMTAGLVEGLCRKRVADTTQHYQTRYVGQSQTTVYAPGTPLDGRTMTVAEAEYRCHVCCDTGWRARVKATGELLGEVALQKRCNPHPQDGIERLSSADYAMVRCACRAQSRAGAA